VVPYRSILPVLLGGHHQKAAGTLCEPARRTRSGIHWKSSLNWEKTKHVAFISQNICLTFSPPANIILQITFIPAGRGPSTIEEAVELETERETELLVYHLKHFPMARVLQEFFL